jgi:hypothetical protein
MKDEIDRKVQAVSAFLAVFPTSETIDDFLSDTLDQNSRQGFIDFAVKSGVIPM